MLKKYVKKYRPNASALAAVVIIHIFFLILEHFPCCQCCQPVFPSPCNTDSSFYNRSAVVCPPDRHHPNRTPVLRSHGNTQRFSFFHWLFCFHSFLPVWSSRDKTSFVTLFILCCWCCCCFFRSLCVLFSQFIHLKVLWGCANTNYAPFCHQKNSILCYYHCVFLTFSCEWTACLPDPLQQPEQPAEELHHRRASWSTLT